MQKYQCFSIYADFWTICHNCFLVKLCEYQLNWANKWTWKNGILFSMTIITDWFSMLHLTPHFFLETEQRNGCTQTCWLKGKYVELTLKWPVRRTVCLYVQQYSNSFPSFYPIPIKNCFYMRFKITHFLLQFDQIWTHYK